MKTWIASAPGTCSNGHGARNRLQPTEIDGDSVELCDVQPSSRLEELAEAGAQSRFGLRLGVDPVLLFRDAGSSSTVLQC
jgi:hypothetical protein